MPSVAAALNGASGAAAAAGAMVGNASVEPVPPPTTALHAASNDEDELGADGADDEGCKTEESLARPTRRHLGMP